ncbi:MAG: hypothetical protein ABEI77_07545 [Halorientalis sp.]
MCVPDDIVNKLGLTTDDDTRIRWRGVTGFEVIIDSTEEAPGEFSADVVEIGNSLGIHVPADIRRADGLSKRDRVNKFYEPSEDESVLSVDYCREERETEQDFPARA